MRLENKTAIVVGGGQSGGSTAAIGNGRATAMLFAREGAKVLVVDRDIDTAQETADSITEEGNIARATAADVTSEEEVAAAIAECKDAWGKVDILHNNVGISVA
ncbi:MAG: SDR family NAD(P)-dependent oxidoreductase, partial [Pseudomonadota bacterium]|nr:SDR family NAD(P)-dependent oxidoreductase [Pseudomonadota bacterium]